MGDLETKVAVITGAGSGMAKASARIFVREGGQVLAADISGAEDQTAKELGSNVVPFHCDVTTEGEVEAMAAAEYGHANIRANAVCPGLILTEIMGASGAANFPDLVKEAAPGRAGKPEEVAELAAFLCTDKAAFISAAIIPVDGGWACSLP